MEIKVTNTDKSGQSFNVVYHDIESETDIKDKNVSGVHAICFYNDKMVIVYSERKGMWTPPGGKVDEGETTEEAVVREVKEESNMKVLSHRFIGYQDIYKQNSIMTQARSVCIVEPYGDFISDPDGDITEIKLIDPEEYKKYFDWGEIGEHIIKRAIEMKNLI